jgi:H+/Cl- antiporter ClcA
VKLIATKITIAAGGSAGKEGPCAQIKGGLSSLFADLLKFDDPDRMKFLFAVLVPDLSLFLEHH